MRYFEGVPSPVKHPQKLNMMIFRENTEDVYAGIESARARRRRRSCASSSRRKLAASKIRQGSRDRHQADVASSDRSASCRKAIEYAIDGDSKHSVTLVHKGNIMKFTEGAFREWGYEVARDEFGSSTIAEAELDGAAPGAERS